MLLTPSSLVILVAWLAALAGAGGWVAAGFLRPRRADERMHLAGDRALGLARIGTAVGLLASVVLAFLVTPATPWIVSAVALALALALGWFPRFESAIYALAMTALSLVAPVAADEAASPRNHDLTGDATMVGVVAFTVLAGTWLTSAVTLGPQERTQPLVRWRLRFLSWAAAAVVLICDGTCLLAHPWSANSTWHLVRLACALAIAATSLMAAPAAALAACALGMVGQVAAVQTLVLTPAGAGPAPADVAALGYSVAAGPTLHNLALQWRVNLFFLALAIVAVAVYLLLVVRLQRRGDRWPVGRTAAWLIGWIVMVLVTSSGVGRYAPAVFSVHMFMNLAINMLCAMVLVLGGFITLVLRAVPARGRDEPAGLREWVTATMHSRYLGFLYNPIIALVFMTGTYYVFYLTGIYTASLQSHWLHQLFYLHFLVSGYVFYGLIIGVDQPPHPLPHIGKLGLIIGAMPFHAFFGVILMSKGDIFAQRFLTSLGYPWVAGRGLLHDQWVGGTIAWAGGEFPLVIALLALLTQWSRQDRKEGRRIDRHLDAGTDQSYDAYNEMLAQLAARDRDNQRPSDLHR